MQLKGLVILLFLQQVINGVTIGCSYALVAIGYNMVFGVLELVNFSHSSVFMFGAYIAATVLGKQFGAPAAFLIAIVGCALFGIGIDRFALMPMRKKGASKISFLICTLGLSTFLQNVIFLFFGSESIVYRNVFPHGHIRIGGALISYLQIIVLLTTLVLMVFVLLFVQKTKLGASMRAVAQNSVAARLMGINVDNVITFTFAMGSALAAVAGILIGMCYGSVDLQIGFSVGMKTFAAAIIGGVGVIHGSVAGGLIIGVAESLFAGYVSSGYKDIVAFVLLILVLMVRPSGLFGKKNATKV